MVHKAHSKGKSYKESYLISKVKEERSRVKPGPSITDASATSKKTITEGFICWSSGKSNQCKLL